MDDRVGDILAARATLDAGRAPAILLSLLMHGGISALAIWSAMHATAPQQVPVLNIRFAAPVGGQAHSPAAPVAQPRTPVPPLEKPPEKPKIEGPKPRLEDVKPTAAKPVPNAVPLSPFGKSPKKGAENPVVTPPVGPPPVPAGGSGVTGLEGGDFPYSIYIERMHTLIGQKWLRPQMSNATTIIYFIIDRDGTIRDAKVETSSMNPTFDRAALRAVLESSPLPPLPFGYGGTFLGVHLTFR
jgi:TonB family protein